MAPTRIKAYLATGGMVLKHSYELSLVNFSMAVNLTQHIQYFTSVPSNSIEHLMLLQTRGPSNTRPLRKPNRYKTIRTKQHKLS